MTAPIPEKKPAPDSISRKDTGISEDKNHVPQPPDNPAQKPPMYADDPKGTLNGSSTPVK